MTRASEIDARATPSPERTSAVKSLESRRLDAALTGDRKAVAALVSRLTPVIQARVARVLFRGGAAARRGALVRQDVQDLTQDVFVALFARQGRVLRTWNPDAGSSLEGFVGMVAEREALSRIRSRKRSPLTEAPTEAAALERSTPPSLPEREVSSRSSLRALLRKLEQALSPLGMRVFTVLFVEDADMHAAAEQLGMSPDAVYQWRTRIRRTARDLSQSEDREVTS